MFSWASESIWTSEDDDTRVFSVQMSSDNQYVASGHSNGILSLRSVQTGRLSYQLSHSPGRFPVTSCRFHPKDCKILLAISAEGLIKEWNTKSSQCTWTLQESNNQLYALAYSRDGSKFATGGKDAKLRIYDDETKKIINEFSRNEFDLETTRGHCNRINAITWHPTDPNILLSAGWDNSLQVWDLRSPIAVKSMIGPNVSGDALDVNEELILTGSWRTENQIQLFDLKTYQPVNTVQWGMTSDDPQCQLYFTKFYPKGGFIIAGGSGVNQLKAFSTESLSPTGASLAMTAPIVCACFDAAAEHMVIGTGDGRVSLRAVSVKNE